MTAARLNKDVVTVCCVGDSRAYLVRDSQASILTEGAGKQKLGSGAIQPLIKQVNAKDRDLLLLMTDGAWTRFSLYTLTRTVGRYSVLPELPTVILEQASKVGVWDDMTVVVVTVRR
jgi:serine/threonine protein phosphatase PrpC